jgi:hypothetical protein
MLNGGTLKDVFFLYELLDPVSNLPRYVGITNNIRRRYLNHLNSLTTKTKKNWWIKSLLAKNLKPIIRIIAASHKDDIGELEIKTIADYRKKYANLTNLSDGGSTGAAKLAHKKRQIAIVGISLTCDKIVKFDSITIAQNYGFSRSSIMTALKRKNASACGYVWVRAEKQHILQAKKCDFLNKKDPRSVGVIGTRNNETITFASISDCRNAGFKNVSRAVKTNIKCKGYYWRYQNNG